MSDFVERDWTLNTNMAFAMMQTAHKDQYYNGAPFILHPLGVLLQLKGRENTERHTIVALLHDVVEDNNNFTIEMIRGAFGEEIALDIEAITRRKGEEYEDYIERCGNRRIARQVKIADLHENLSNVTSPNCPVKHKNKTKRWGAALQWLLVKEVVDGDPARA